MRSDLLSLDFKDLLKGFFMAIFASIVGILLESAKSGEFVFNLETIKAAAIVGALGYLKMKFFTNNAGELLKKNRPFDFDIQPPSGTRKTPFGLQ